MAGIYTGRRGRGDGVSGAQTAGADVRLSTSRFRERQNLEFDSFFLWTSDRLGLGKNLSYGSRIGFPNEPWSGSLSYEVVEKHHEPTLGFVPRTGFKNLNPRFAYAPRPQRHPWIRRLDFTLDSNLLVDEDNRWLTRDFNWQVARVETHRQDSIGFNIQPAYDRLEEDFEIAEGIILPAGEEYSVTRYRVSGNTANRRVISGRASYGWGGFFSGTRRETSVNVTMRPRPGIRVQMESEWNDVNLQEGEFATRIYRLISDTQFNPWIFVVANVQYDTVSAVLGWQTRFRWTLDPGNDVFFIYTHNWYEDPELDRFRTLDRRGAIKAVYTRRF
jgi:hypothetical protein